MDVTLPFKLKQFVEGEIKAGRFKNSSDAITEGIRLLKQRDDLAARLPDLSSLGPSLDGGGDIEALAFLVMMDAAKSAQEDLKAIMAGVKAINAAKSALRGLIAKIGYDICENAAQQDGRPPLKFNSPGVGSESGYHCMPVPHPEPGCSGGLRLVPTDMHKGPIKDVCVLRAIREELLGTLDSMSEMSEMTSLRLQMAMDRRSKFISTLSNIMKKMSDTDSSIIANLK